MIMSEDQILMVNGHSVSVLIILPNQHQILMTVLQQTIIVEILIFAHFLRLRLQHIHIVVIVVVVVQIIVYSFLVKFVQ